MGVLEKLGLAPKRKRPASEHVDESGSRGDAGIRGSLLVKAGIFAVLVFVTFAAFPRERGLQLSAQTGDVWRSSTLVAPYDFALRKDPRTVEEERERARRRVAPLFRELPNAAQRVAVNRDTVAAQLERISSAYGSYRRNLAAGASTAALQDSLRYVASRRAARLKLTPGQWRGLMVSRSDEAAAADSSGTNSLEAAPQAGLLTAAWETADELLQRPVIDIPLDSVRADEIVARNEAERTDRQLPKSAVLGLNDAHRFAQERLSDAFPNDAQAAELAYAHFLAIFQPSHVYLRGETLREIQRQERRVSPTVGIVRAGEVIVREGERITPEIRQRIESFASVERERSGAPLRWKVVLGHLLLICATYVLFFLYLLLLRRKIFDDNQRVLLIALLFAGIVGLFAVAVRLPMVPAFAVPVAVAAILLTVIFDSRVGLFGMLTLGLLGGHFLQYDFVFTFATLVAGALGVFSVRDIKNRGQFFVSAGLVFLGYVLVLAATWLIEETPRARIYSDLLQVGVNSFLLLLAYPLLWVFERAFDITTDLTLLELSDTNRNLLKQLSITAPGTFNHVLQVANLAEAAADAIGANALLARVGALYHDIGKMTKPEFFVENQRPGENPHDSLKPRMSALIIASHVKEGLERGRKENLPERVLKFVPMHHGSTRIEYFYRKAVDQRGPDDPPIDESEFRYPGPPPDSKETGIMMLADSVEAASRSLAEPTQKRLEAVVDMIFKARMEDGQLDNTLLTFRDLRVARETFLSLLMGIYHIRIKYPDQEGAETSPPAAPDPGSKEPDAHEIKRASPPGGANGSIEPTPGPLTGEAPASAAVVIRDEASDPGEELAPLLDDVYVPEDEDETAGKEVIEFDPALRAKQLPFDAEAPSDEDALPSERKEPR